MLTDEMTARISSLLSREGCAECYIFGSHVTGGADAGSDIDIGVVGLPPQRFFAVHPLLEDATKSAVDLVDSDEKPKFFALLRDLGELKRIR